MALERANPHIVQQPSLWQVQESQVLQQNQLIDQGWGIDTHQIVGDGPRDLAVVIPSPARTNNPELANAWVHKEVESAKIRSKKAKGGAAQFEKDEHRALGVAGQTDLGSVPADDAEGVDSGS